MLRAAEVQALRLLVQGAPLRQVLHEILAAFEEMWEGTHCSVLLLDPRKRILRLGAAPTLPVAFSKAIESLAIGPRAGSCGTCAWRARTVICEDVASDPLWEPFRGPALENGLRACWSVPVLAGDGQVLATFAVYHRQPCRPEPRSLDALTGWSSLVALAVERDRTDAALRDSEALLRMASEASRLGAWRVELPDMHLTCSDEVRVLCEAPPELQPTLESFFDFLPPASRAAFEPEFRACAREGRSFDRELELVTAGGRRLWVRAVGCAHRDESGRIVAVLGALQDITERRRLDQQFVRAQRLESLGTLASGVAHDLNNLLSPILMALPLLERGEAAPQRRELLETIRTSAEQGRDLVSRVLTFSRGVDGQRVAVEVPDLVRDLAKLFSGTISRDVQLEVQVAPDLWPLWADPTQVQQVLLNLCVNARDAMPDGGLLTLRARNVAVDEHYVAGNLEAHPGNYVCLEVQDTGSGIPSELVERIFEPFFTTKPTGVGTGLGLSTTLGIVRGHGGFVQVYSEPGKGSRFRVYLPTSQGRPEPRQPEEAPARPCGHGELILVVDDEDFLRRMTCRTLEAFGYRTLPAADGAQAVELFRHHRDEVAAVLTDMGMPVMDGPATVRALAEIEPGVRILCTSGWAPEILAQGVREFLPKPCTAETLLQSIHRVLTEG